MFSLKKIIIGKEFLLMYILTSFSGINIKSNNLYNLYIDKF